ncbi:hypothetical protein JRQ81_007293 [Phrynocephalus forsythii]|uniref:Uncharacterized protein n=1 Tax=Phrynocephalus forsythii TaxID=171643 RepID=A0A9Q0XEX4_9SAUR|nr:hypothetical protein JRQ81_007293 [Phrynocephalus forsythii]
MHHLWTALMAGPEPPGFGEGFCRERRSLAMDSSRMQRLQNQKGTDRKKGKRHRGKVLALNMQEKLLEIKDLTELERELTAIHQSKGQNYKAQLPRFMSLLDVYF